MMKSETTSNIDVQSSVLWTIIDQCLWAIMQLFKFSNDFNVRLRILPQRMDCSYIITDLHVCGFVQTCVCQE